MSDIEVGAVTGELELRGWWYPPDAIRATHEGRATYAPLAGDSISYTLDRSTRALIAAAIRAIIVPARHGAAVLFIEAEES